MVSYCTSRRIFLLVLCISFSFLTYAPVYVNSQPIKICKFDQVYNLGDSQSDTGNLKREDPTTNCAKLPYGETFFKKATGRCSNGRLMIDYIAMAVGVPLLPPSKKIDADFKHGVNFAVAGCTALPRDFLQKKYNIEPRYTNNSLIVQLDWMLNHFNSICKNGDCNEKLNSALFMVGEIGGNDYNYALDKGMTMDELKGMVPHVVDSILGAVKKVIDFGATRVVVPGNYPIGCFPTYLSRVGTNITYDEDKCVKHFNDFSKYHNKKLKQALRELKQHKPNAIIVYGDYYNAYLDLLGFAKSHGFNTKNGCCGGKDESNTMRFCGTRGASVCEDPNKFVSWDGMHLTQISHEFIANWLLNDIFSKLQCGP